MARLRYNGLTATLGAPLTSTDTTITFAAALTSAAGAVPTITGSDTIALSILDTTGAVSEIVSLTAYTSGATTGTITRAQESTAGVAHSSGDQVVHSPTAADFASSGSTGDASWTAVTTFQNSWGNVGAPWTTAAYRKDGQGFVHVKGIVTGGANNTVIFTLPAGYRPGAQENFPCSSSAAYAQVKLGTDGTVYVVIRPSADICMSFTFYAEA